MLYPDVTCWLSGAELSHLSMLFPRIDILTHSHKPENDALFYLIRRLINLVMDAR